MLKRIVINGLFIAMLTFNTGYPINLSDGLIACIPAALGFLYAYDVQKIYTQLHKKEEELHEQALRNGRENSPEHVQELKVLRTHKRTSRLKQAAAVVLGSTCTLSALNKRWNVVSMSPALNTPESSVSSEESESVASVETPFQRLFGELEQAVADINQQEADIAVSQIEDILKPINEEFARLKSSARLKFCPDVGRISMAIRVRCKKLVRKKREVSSVEDDPRIAQAQALWVPFWLTEDPLITGVLEGLKDLDNIDARILQERLSNNDIKKFHAELLKGILIANGYYATDRKRRKRGVILVEVMDEHPKVFQSVALPPDVRALKEKLLELRDVCAQDVQALFRKNELQQWMTNKKFVHNEGAFENLCKVIVGLDEECFTLPSYEAKQFRSCTQ